MWKKTDTPSLKEDDKIKYITTKGSQIARFKSISKGKDPYLNAYIEEKGKRKYKRPKVNSIKEIFVWVKPKSTQGVKNKNNSPSSSKQRRVPLQDIPRIHPKTLITIHKKNNSVMNDVVFHKVEDGLLKAFVVNGERKLWSKTPISDISSVYTSDEQFKETIGPIYKKVHPRDYSQLISFLQKHDTIAYVKRDGNVVKDIRVGEVELSNGKPKLKLYYPGSNTFFQLYPASTKEFYIKGKKIENSNATEPLDDPSDKVPDDKPKAASASMSDDEKPGDTCVKLEYLYNEINSLKETIGTLSLKVEDLLASDRIKDHQIILLKKYVAKLVGKIYSDEKMEE